MFFVALLSFLKKNVDFTTPLCYNDCCKYNNQGATMEQRFETFTALVAGISRDIRKIKNEEMAEFHLKGPHVSCLYYLYTKGDLHFTALCDLCEEDKANMSRIIDDLEGRGYIVARTARRYRAPIRLSDEGRTLGAHVADKVDRVLSAVSDGVSEEDRCTLYECLSKIHTNLQKFCESYENGSKRKVEG